MEAADGALILMWNMLVPLPNHASCHFPVVRDSTLSFRLIISFLVLYELHSQRQKDCYKKDNQKTRNTIMKPN